MSTTVLVVLVTIVAPLVAWALTAITLPRDHR